LPVLDRSEEGVRFARSGTVHHGGEGWDRYGSEYRDDDHDDHKFREREPILSADRLKLGR